MSESLPAREYSQSKQDRRQAVDLEALVRWAVMTQKADRDDVALFDAEAAVDGLEPRGWSVDGVAAMMRRGDIGCRIDGGGVLRGVAPRLHPDAEAVVAATDRIRDNRARSLVLHYSRIGERPDFLPWEQRLVPLPGARYGSMRHPAAVD